MKTLHIADLHFQRDRYDEAASSVHALCDDIDRNGADLVVVSGDTWDGPVQNTAGARFADFLELVREIADRAPVAMIYGTPSHDTDGSLEVFEQIQAKHGIEILRPGQPYGLTTGGVFCNLNDSTPRDGDQLKALLFGVPEPNKKWLLANAGATGKDEADAMARAALRALFMGLGGLRKQYPDLPCILLYHGEVAGAKSATGYGAEAGVGLAVTRDDLAAVGADYYALGHIHEPQKIGDLPAFYPGSIYPINWGETHKAGANRVEISRGMIEHPADLFASNSIERAVAVSRLDFPLPQRMKLSTTWPNGPDAFDKPGEVAGKLVWIEATATKEQALGFDAEASLANLLANGALPGSRVTVNVLPTETVRAAEITEQRTLADKVRVWAEASALEVTQPVLTKAATLEREAAASGASAFAGHFRIDRLVLRGAIGIWKKSRKDEVDLDLLSYGPGVLALVGANGAGKTTILENLHPWPCMLTRDGSLKDHFRLRDSCRDLYLTDKRTGARYRALISIRADIASGAVEYFLYRDTGSGFEPLPGINGRKEPYEAAVAELFGSLEMYLRTAFQTQRPSKFAPDLATATARERKNLFGELAGIDYLDRYRLEAKARADSLSSDLVRVEATIAAAADVDDVLTAARAEITLGREAEASGDLLSRDAAARRDRVSAEVDSLRASVGQLERKADRAETMRAEIAALLREVDAAALTIETATKAAEGREAAEKELEAIVALEREKAEIEAAETIERRKFDQVLAAYNEARRAADDRRRLAQSALDDARRNHGMAERELAVARARLTAPVVDTCPTCGQSLPADRLAHLEAEHRKNLAEVERLEGEVARLAAAESDAAAALAAITGPGDPPVLPPFPGADRLHEVNRSLEWTDRADAEETIRTAREAAVRIDEATKRKALAETAAASKRPELETLEREAAGLADLRTSERAKADELARIQDEYTEARSALEGARARITAAETALAAAEKRRAARDEAQAKRETLAIEIADWRFLERACGPDGIQALELDALAPSIAAVSNRILTEAYGSRYQIEFRTTRIAGKGSKTKQVEDFEIFVLDTETGDEQTIDSLSGGEAVWIRKALYDGFAIIRAKNTDVQFLNVFLDEADGALDPEARMLYLRMLEAAHREAGRFQTILISHSTEIQAMVERVINVADLTARETASMEAVA